MYRRLICINFPILYSENFGLMCINVVYVFLICMKSSLIIILILKIFEKLIDRVEMHEERGIFVPSRIRPDKVMMRILRNSFENGKNPSSPSGVGVRNTLPSLFSVGIPTEPTTKINHIL